MEKSQQTPSTIASTTAEEDRKGHHDHYSMKYFNLRVDDSFNQGDVLNGKSHQSINCKTFVNTKFTFGIW